MDQRLGVSLFVLRLSVFVVMVMWSIDKLLDPEGSARIFESFYHIGGLEAGAMYAIGLAQIAIEIAFVLGVARFWTYGFVLVTHGISTLSSWQQYLSPFDHMMFLAAIPMLAACVTLFLLRDRDNLFSLGR
ncbi:hypothetical protein [Aquisalimonas sp.]|uniref:hypothetical protein n=1 Tax=Aquisalimonas sp. TaxID=1872621 RepID=UPI0025C6A063|nr:hypothetical protein [Aquisalimonas sp.]